MDILYLHGWGAYENGKLDNTEEEYLYTTTKNLYTGKIYAPSWHFPNYDDFTLSSALNFIINYIDQNIKSKKINIIGYSFGGLIALHLSNLIPNKINKILLCACAIDNFERRIKYNNIHTYKFINDLFKYQENPVLKNNCIVIHGMNDNDYGGGDISRIKKFVEKNKKNILDIFYPNTDHSLASFLLNKNSDNLFNKIFKTFMKE